MPPLPTELLRRAPTGRQTMDNCPFADNKELPFLDCANRTWGELLNYAAAHKQAEATNYQYNDIDDEPGFVFAEGSNDGAQCGPR